MEAHMISTVTPDRRSERKRTQDARDVDKLRVALRPRCESVTRQVADPFDLIPVAADPTF